MRVLILGGTQFVGRHIGESLLAAGHRVSILAGPRLTWAEYMRVLGAENFVWVASEIIASAGLTFLDLPLYRPERGARSSLMEVDHVDGTATPALHPAGRFSSRPVHIRSII